MTLEKHLISKSSYIRGLQCKKSFYLYVYNNDLMDEQSEGLKQIFDTGHDVGEYAQRLFPNGINCGMDVTRNAQKSVELTSKAIKDGSKVIYEAAFQYKGVLVITDILLKINDGWEVYEVKSFTKIENYHYDDPAIQYYVIKGCGLNIDDISFIHINNQYIRQGDIEPEKLFNVVSVFDEVIKKQNEIEINIKSLKKILLSDKIPEIDIGKHCSYPYNCSFHGYCWKHISKYSVFNISRLGTKKFDLYYKNIIELKDIPKDTELNDKQWLEVESFLNNTDYIDKSRLKSFLDSFEYPLYFMDFETAMYAIPKHENSRPYQQITFQYCLYYKQDRNSELILNEFLAESDGSDPRRKFIENLLKNTKAPGKIIVFNKTFEVNCLKELAELFPELEGDISERIERIVDLMVPFRDKLYYKPQMKGSYSMKYVLPAIAPEYSYDNLEIKGGSMAGPEFDRLEILTDENEIMKVRQDLLDYCRQDTYGMIVVLNELEKVSKS